jgi:hypothetical protein
MEELRLLERLHKLSEAGVVFIVAGELAATLHGAPICAFEFEVVRRDGAAALVRDGRISILGSIGHGRTYEDLLPHSVEMDIGGGVHVRVLDLETLIAVKEEVGGEKDRAVLPILRRTLEEKRKMGL